MGPPRVTGYDQSSPTFKPGTLPRRPILKSATNFWSGSKSATILWSILKPATVLWPILKSATILWSGSKSGTLLWPSSKPGTIFRRTGSNTVIIPWPGSTLPPHCPTTTDILSSLWGPPSARLSNPRVFCPSNSSPLLHTTTWVHPLLLLPHPCTTSPTTPTTTAPLLPTTSITHISIYHLSHPLIPKCIPTAIQQSTQTHPCPPFFHSTQ
mmetsp:Transcript_23808/g.39846  ORF Transcript_23808/g.39846 Transcript_23808/m.39846 type:complete len:211 (+) Transcript_23808:109-741(+)